MKHREERRRYWTALVARFERSGKSRKEFAAEAGVGVAIFQYWLYKLRHEAAVAQKRPPAEVRLVPVTIRSRPAPPERVEIWVGPVKLRVRAGTDPQYVAQLAAALRADTRC